MGTVISRYTCRALPISSSVSVDQISSVPPARAAMSNAAAAPVRHVVADAAQQRQAGIVAGDRPTNSVPLRADLVLSGGGVKGIGLVGAVASLLDSGYGIQRISGTSAGSLVGSVVAAAVDDVGEIE